VIPTKNSIKYNNSRCDIYVEWVFGELGTFYRAFQLKLDCNYDLKKIS